MTRCMCGTMNRKRLCTARSHKAPSQTGHTESDSTLGARSPRHGKIPAPLTMKRSTRRPRMSGVFVYKVCT
ncbi:hypothetical protein B0H10DRAFT_911468 [Mycena sp. CBHHK59/15]|nr:hypothetical protein B0H10DRAFT_911468 [Mycena sp. CBHHK59/15]